MSTTFISVRLRSDGWYSVDISGDRHSGGYCRLFRWLGDVVCFIRNETNMEYATLYSHPFNQGDWQSW